MICDVQKGGLEVIYYIRLSKLRLDAIGLFYSGDSFLAANLHLAKIYLNDTDNDSSDISSGTYHSLCSTHLSEVSLETLVTEVGQQYVGILICLECVVKRGPHHHYYAILNNNMIITAILIRQKRCYRHSGKYGETQPAVEVS